MYFLLSGLEADLLKCKTGPLWSSQCLLSWSSFSWSGSTQVESRWGEKWTCHDGMFLSYLSKSFFPPTITNLPHQQWFFFFEIFFCIAIIPIKLSISLMLMRVAGPKKNYTYALWGMASLFILANTISFLYILLRCTPISFAWNTKTPGGSCLPSRDLADVYYADTAVNILTDWFCALM